VAARQRGGRGKNVAAPGARGSSGALVEQGNGRAEQAVDSAPSGEAGDDTAETPAATASAAERRRATAIVIGLWRDLARDLLLVRLDDERHVRDPGLLDDLRVAADRLDQMPDAPGEPVTNTATPDAAIAAFLTRLDAVGELVEANARPELALDGLLLGWPRSAVG
jgi:hypothetical protein